MTADRTAAGRRRLLTVAGTAGILLGTAACSSSGGVTGTGSLSYDHVRSTAQGLAGTGPCPFGLDLPAALKAAGIDRPVTPGSNGGPAVTTDLGNGRPAEPWPSGFSAPPSMASVPATPPTAWVTCAYTVGSAPVQIDLLAVPENGVAINMMLPYIQKAGGIGVDQLTRFAEAQPTAGQTKLTPGAESVGVARVAANGKGDIALTLSQSSSDAGPEQALTGEALRKATERLAAQLRP
ncbi:hypothetical protein ACFWA9_21245 [Kitasatospora sp. NPDC059973]|uniref:hypothetical protein n=1 Tax=Kitasatospora sp. NPDC059973 TaxID=3347020 RepID=UPI0036A50AFF